MMISLESILSVMEVIGGFWARNEHDLAYIFRVSPWLTGKNIYERGAGRGTL